MVCLVVEPASLKNMNVSWDYHSQLNEQTKFMVQTTNQSSFSHHFPIMFPVEI